MTPTSVLLRMYYERLYERMAGARDRLIRRIEEWLPVEIDRRGFGDVEAEKLEAYRDACIAFIDERLESYNPIGIQYTFARAPSQLAAELEFELNWYHSRAEFADLVAATRALAGAAVSDDALPPLADELIARVGAFPDRSIIAAYHAEPALQKLPDYLVACAIEEIICGREPSP